MVCYYPITAYRVGSVQGGFTTLHNPVIASKKGGVPFKHPCGQCIGCRYDKAKEWAVRCVHEASLYEHNAFITLTMNDEYLLSRPNPWSLQRGKGSEYELFMKRLRKKFGNGIRFYMCGEYGENCFTCFKNERYCNCDKYIKTIGRPHYHAILFNIEIFDKIPYKQINGNWLYTSDSLQSVWSDPVTKMPLGFVSVGDVTHDSAGYVARYTTKKITGKGADKVNPDTGLKHYERFDPRTGEIHVLEPEYNNMSRKGGIGKGWLDKYSAEVLINDNVIAKNYPVPVPRYYDKILEEIYPHRLEENKNIRIDKAMKHMDNNTQDRLIVREAIFKRKVKQLPRKEL